MLINIWPVNCMAQLKMTNKKVKEDNGKEFYKGNVRYQKVCRFYRNELWKNIGCLVSDPTFGLGGLRLWDKEE